MNEQLIKKIIKCKLNVADFLIKNLPEKMSEDVKNLGKVILEGVNESFQEIKEQPANKTKTENKLQNVTIE